MQRMFFDVPVQSIYSMGEIPDAAFFSPAVPPDRKSAAKVGHPGALLPPGGTAGAGSSRRDIDKPAPDRALNAPLSTPLTEQLRTANQP